jgi:tRNA(adenine34) deaminase
MSRSTWEFWMGEALREAQASSLQGDVPVGAILVDGEGALLAAGGNRREQDHDPSAHAEIVVLRAAGQKLQRWRFPEATLIVTLEPCAMCAGAILQARVKRLVYGADDPKAGAVRTVANLPDSPLSYHHLEVVAGIRESACRMLLQDWFRNRVR